MLLGECVSDGDLFDRGDPDRRDWCGPSLGEDIPAPVTPRPDRANAAEQQQRRRHRWSQVAPRTGEERAP
jgi:hypothetical protein